MDQPNYISIEEGKSLVAKKEKCNKYGIANQGSKVTAIGNGTSTLDKRFPALYSRRCYKFVPNKKTKDSCHCGRPKEFHNSIEKKDAWHFQRNTSLEDRSLVGEVVFKTKPWKVATPKIKSLARVALPDEEKKQKTLETVSSLLSDHWKLAPPEMMLSFVGGQKDIRLDESFGAAFRDGVINLIKQKSNVWMFSGGTNTGLSKILGKAIKTIEVAKLTDVNDLKNVACFGIAPWGYVQHCTAMEDHFANDMPPSNNYSEGEGSNALLPSVFEYDGVSKKFKNNSVQSGRVNLDPHHTHYLLIDDGTIGKYGYEHLFRADLESFLVQTGIDGWSTPHVVILIEGGLNAIEFVHRSLELNTPCVVIQGSGRVADCLALAHKKVERETQLSCQDELDEDKIQSIVRQIVCELKEKPLYNRILVECLKYRELISVFDPEHGAGLHTGIDVAIYEAHLKKVTHKKVFGDIDPVQHFQHSLDWGRVKFAKLLVEESKAQSRKWKHTWDPHFGNYMTQALMENKHEFITMFFQVGFDLKDPVTYGMLIQLYKVYFEKKKREQELEDSPGIGLPDIKQLLRRANGNNVALEQTESEESLLALMKIDHELKISVGEFYRSHFLEKMEGTKEKSCCKTNIVYSSNLENIELTVSPNPYPDLFTWSVLMELDEISLTFLTKGKNSIAACLLACNCMLHKINATSDQQKLENLRNKFAMFENHAIGILNLCYQENPLRTQMLLVRQVTAFGNVSCLKLAVEGMCLNFMGQAACQTHLNCIWRRCISTEHSTLTLLLCLFVPFLIPFLINFQRRVDFGDLKTENINDSWFELTKIGVDVGVKRKWNVFEKIYEFYRAPIMKMFSHLCFYCLFLLLFSMVLVFDPDHEKVSQYMTLKPGPVESIVFIYWISFCIQELHQMFQNSERGLKTSIILHLSHSLWNIFDLLIIGNIILAFSLRFFCLSLGTQECQQTFSLNEIVRLFYVTLFMLFLLRILPIFYSIPKLGPMLFMIWKMFSDLFYFILILFVFMGTYGVASYVLVFQAMPKGNPNQYHVNMFSVIFEVFKRPYWGLFGELDPELSDVESLDDAANKVPKNDSSFYYKQATSHLIFPFFQAVYMLIANILLLNLLIAMFSYSINDIQAKAQQLWAFSRHDLILEYYSRSILPQPFSILLDVLKGIRSLARNCNCLKERRKVVSRKMFVAIFNNLKSGPVIVKMLRRWEKTVSNSYFVSREQDERKSPAERLRVLEKKMDKLLDNIG